jgi:tripartite-type tricarboxylate transporter receptor subunit TctC
MLSAWQVGAWAQPYPNKAIRLVVPAVAGGGASVVARLVGEYLGARWKQSIVVDNRPGAGGVIGVDAVAKSKPDGYTMLLGYASAVTVNPFVYQVPYRPVDDFSPATLIASSPFMMVLHPSLPMKTVKEFIAFARARPNVLSYSSSGNGTMTHLAGELFKNLAQIEMTHVPYKGAVIAFTDVLSGQVPINFPTPTVAIPHIQSGRLRALGVTSLKRSSVFPELPTIAEGGLPGFEVDNWYGVLFPAETASQIVDKTRAEINNLLQQPNIRQQFLAQGIEPAGSSPAEFADVIKKDMARWAKVVQNIKLQVD